MKRVLLAYDGSNGARRALDEMASLVREGDVVTVIAVAEGLPLYGYPGAMPSEEQDKERRRQLGEARELLAERGISPSLVQRGGDPATAILEQAEKAGADLIVMGTRGMSTVERWLLGSVSTRVVHHARCSVLVAR